MDVTAKQIESTEKEYSAMFKEPVTVEFITTETYIFGSELACLRAFHVFRNNETTTFGYSENLQTWFCSFTPSIYQ